MIRRLYYWALDYAYALKWQLRAFTRHRPPASYQTGRPGASPIILIPGVYEPWHFMKPLADALSAAGHPIFFIEQLGYHTLQIPAAAAATRHLIDTHHLQNAIIVAHSKGGLVGKYVLARHNHDHAVVRLIAIHTPFSGSIYASLWLLPTVRIFSPRSPLIRQLSTETAINSNIISIYGQFDPHIPRGSHLEGATNILLPTMGHFRILNIEVVKQTILNWTKQ